MDMKKYFKEFAAEHKATDCKLKCGCKPPESKKFKCPNVGCDFYSYDHGSVKGQYALNRHKTTCKKSLGKKLRKRIKDGLDNLGLDALQKLINIAEKNNITFT
jgi:hypothetical protein